MIDCSTCSVLGCQFNATNPKKSCEMYKPYMTPRIALHCMKVNCAMALCENCDIYGTVGTDHCFEDACREAIESLKKQISKEPFEHDKKIYNQALEDFKKELIKIYNKRYMHDIYLDDIDSIVESLSK